jgi:hypothetical protein
MTSELVALSVLSLDYPAPPTGWAAELARRGVAISLDDLGRESIPRDAARGLLEEHRAEVERRARHLAEVERRAIEADQAFRATLPPGIRPDQVPEGMTPAELMTAGDRLGQGSRRQSVLEHALAHASGAVVFHRFGDD